MIHNGLIDREEEYERFRGLLEIGSPQLALLTGRRRVGKTYLMTRVWDHRFFLYTASRTSAEINRRQLLEDLAGWSGLEIHVEDYPTWRSVFNVLFDLPVADPLIIVLDEFQYLANDMDGVASLATELNAAWERPRSPRSLVLVLSGSVVGTMEALAAGGGPLYGRFNWQCHLQPFNYRHTAEMACFKALRDRALAYGIFGGTPRYLATLNPAESLASNTTRLWLAPGGEVRLLVETALEQEEGLRDVSKYRAILQSVASGRTTRNEIAQGAGLPNDTGLRDKLSRLVELGYVELNQNFGAGPGVEVRYGIADPAFRFYHRFVQPALSMLERYPARRIWNSHVAPHLNTYMGHEFERIVAQAYDGQSEDAGFPLVTEWGRWEGKDRARLPLEIDIVAALSGGGTMTGAVKWNQTPISPEVHWQHMDMLKRAAHAGQRWAFEALEKDAPVLYAAAGGFSPEFKSIAESSGHPVICWTLEDIYRDSV